MTVKKVAKKKVAKKAHTTEVHQHGITGCNIEFNAFDGDSIEMVRCLVHAIADNAEANNTNAKALLAVAETLKCIDITHAIHIEADSNATIADVNLHTK